MALPTAAKKTGCTADTDETKSKGCRFSVTIMGGALIAALFGAIPLPKRKQRHE